MSGPKGVELEVERRTWRDWRESRRESARLRREQADRRELARLRREQARRERAERRQIQQRAKTLSRRVSRLHVEWQEAGRESGGVFTDWRYQDTLRDLTECENDDRRGNKELEAALDRLEGQIAEAQGEFARQSSLARMHASFQAAVEAQAAAEPAAVGSSRKEQAQRMERATRRCADEVSRLIETLDAEVPKEVRTAVETQGDETIKASTASRRNALLAQLHLDIRHANEAAERRRTVAQVEQWRERLRGLEGQAVDELDQQLRQVVDGGTPPADLEKQVDNVVVQAREEASKREEEASKREYALTVITEELENLGYVVESGFETASAQQPEMLLRKPGMEDGYHVSLQAEGSLLHNRVVREAAGSDLVGAGSRSAARGRSDRQAEQTWCEDLAAALAASKTKGVQGRLVSRKKVGEVPVKTIPVLTDRIKTKTRRKRKRKRKRTGLLRSRTGR